MIAQRRIVFRAERPGRYDRRLMRCAFATGPNGAIRHRRRQISAVGASIATSIRAGRLPAPPPPRTLEQIEAALADAKVGAAEKSRLHQRAELVRGLLTPRPTDLLST